MCNAEGLEDRSTAGAQDSDTWSAHKTEAGVLYYYNALTGESTYQRPPGYKGEVVARRIALSSNITSF